MSINDSWAPICRDCKTQTIVAMNGKQTCVRCGLEWDGSEIDDTVAPDSRNDVMAILAWMWKRGAIERRA